jgi:hypothetical protein
MWSSHPAYVTRSLSGLTTEMPNFAESAFKSGLIGGAMWPPVEYHPPTLDMHGQ